MSGDVHPARRARWVTGMAAVGAGLALTSVVAAASNPDGGTTKVVATSSGDQGTSSWLPTASPDVGSRDRDDDDRGQIIVPTPNANVTPTPATPGNAPSSSSRGS